MAHSYEELRKRYAGSIWLRSEWTMISGPIRGRFDSYPEKRWEVTLTTVNGTQYTVTTYGEVLAAIFDTGQQLLVFKTMFDEVLVDFAVVTDTVKDGVRKGMQDSLAGGRKELGVRDG